MADKNKNCLNEMQEMPISIDEYIDILLHEPKEERGRLLLEACDRGMKKIQASKEIEEILEKIKALIPERELEYYKALLTAKDDEQKKKIIISHAEKSDIELVPGELEIYIKNATPEKILHQLLDIAFHNTTDPQMIIFLGYKLGMSFTQNKAEEIAERHKSFKVVRASELTEEETEEMARSYYNSGVWKDMIPQDKEISQEPPLIEIDGKKYLSPEIQRRTLAYMFGRNKIDENNDKS